MLRSLKRLWQDQCGQDLVEYALLMVIIALGVVASVRTVGQSVANGMTAASSNLMAQVPGSSGGQQSSGGGQQQGDGNQGQGNGHGDGDGNGHGNGNGGNGSNGQGNGSQGGSNGNGP